MAKSNMFFHVLQVYFTILCMFCPIYAIGFFILFLYTYISEEKGLLKM